MGLALLYKFRAGVCGCSGWWRMDALAAPEQRAAGGVGHHGRGEEPLMRRCCRNSQMPSAAFDGPWHRPALEGTVIVALRGQTPTTTAPCQAEHRR